ncbi:flagellin N-terminal helical domain-containing protein [Clostridium chauvoei]|uniref:Flagellin n=3 Tax=Clostridium chauvoei TaxID=46867 RepID=A0A1U6J577_9CLOT|nr:flagellin [Clostridium chauvoei]ATD54629.1 flagellin [Clostridium chauvoei]ATD57689.1 flagellin [Clostridium chauvoei]MBX7279922.1 flagellin [Clostridium chauvoei]MBX7282419.1 flagellin [Clostridium chauvoei]MBX7284813.1 flagellin [Clostridium chauvoei]
MRLSHNMESMNIYKNYKNNLKLQSKSLTKISTGSKINSSKDNSNKLAMSEGLRMQIRGLQSAERNLQDGISMIQNVDGALTTVNESLLRMKELIVQANNGTNVGKDLEAIQIEIKQLKEDIDFTVRNSDFNGVNLLSNDKVYNNDYPEFKSHMIGANVKEELQIPMFNVTTGMLKDKDGNSIREIDVTDKDKSAINLDTVNAAISSISNVRSRYGAIQNRMETSRENLDSTSLTFEKAESMIRDTDVALEIAEYSRTSILHNTALSILNQSNNFPQDVLEILQNIR